MTYLSRIWINPLRRQGQRLLGDPYGMHAAVLGGLATQGVTERVLWRLDSDEPRRPALFVLTRSKPSWEHLVEQASWPSSDVPQAEVRPYEPLLQRLTEGQSYAFRLTANPVQSTKQPEKPTARQRERSQGGGRARSVRLGHRTVEHQLSWLLRRTAKWGFEVPPARSSKAMGDLDARDVRITERSKRSFHRNRDGRRGTNGAGPVTLQVVTFEGQLVVTDADALREHLLNGCGPAKAFGCGLLTLAPLLPTSEIE